VEESAGGAIQLRNTYIITPTRDGLMVIDQHRAHVRILYDNYLSMISGQEFVGQATMFPDVVELSPSQNAVLTDLAPRLAELGFILTHQTATVWSIDGIPSVIKDASPRDLLLDMIERVTETGEEPGSTLRDRVALSLAKSSAIGRGRPLSQNEMDRLVSDLLRLPSPALTPDGKRVFTIIPADKIARILG
ncbi:MAG: DNA mismatch repair protein MutL, partial [Duncaniella sp.]|nr:DNA mismatch repair protein MutL [Duncaniella sp.]